MNFLQKTVSKFSLDINITMAVELDDGGLALDYFPIFSFQKISDTNAVLLPDIDFLHWNFYSTQPDYVDLIPYNKKKDSAIFVGASSGGYITRESIDARTHPRLKAAMFFADYAKVKFHVPLVVQYDAEETKELLHNLGIGTGHRIEWPEQFHHKFLISMDGNGATCSRVVISLKSNGVLLKYKSPHQLYYFNGLTPWLHFVPIENDGDIQSIVELEEKFPGYFKMIAYEGQKFAEAYLSRYPAMKYTAWLLKMYAACFDGSESDTTQTEETSINSLLADNGSEMEVLAHVQNSGDAWFSADGWISKPGSKNCLEGFSIESGGYIRKSDLRYQSLSANGVISKWSHAGEFCGTRGKNTPITGFRIQLLGDADLQFECVYHGSFVDGTEIGPTPVGEWCQTATPVPLEAFRLLVKRAG